MIGKQAKNKTNKPSPLTYEKTKIIVFQSKNKELVYVKLNTSELRE